MFFTLQSHKLPIGLPCVGKSALAMLFVSWIALGAATPAHAQRHDLGVGVILGEPTGISAKYWLDRVHAVDLAAAWSLGRNSRIQLMADHVWHTTRFEGLEPGRSYAYYGVGGRLLAGEETAVLGVRVPLGATYLFDEPFDAFIEVVPVFDLLPDTRLTLQLGIGARYYFTSPRGRQ